MQTIQHYVKAAISKAGNQPALAQVLSLNQSNISRYNSGKISPDPAEAIRLARYLRKRPFHLMVLCEAHRAKDPTVKQTWLDLAQFIYQLRI